MKSGRNMVTLYIKVLPVSLTMNTVDSFVKEHLDAIGIPWVLYSGSCQNLVFASPLAMLTEESSRILCSGSYAR